MKKLLFTAYTLDIGGIERALVTLLNTLIEKYKITLVLEKRQGTFLNELNKKIEIIEYRPNNNKNILLRKTINLIKRMKFILKYRHKFDFAASFATYSKMGSFCARTASRNCYLWGHADYLTLFNNDENQVKIFFKELNYTKFKKIIFVSEEGRENFIKIFPKMKEKTIKCNNLINEIKIKNQAKEKINLKKFNEITFLNVGRHDEKQKRLTRLINAAYKLKQEQYKFKILLVGEGPDTNRYKQMVREKHLEDEIILLGQKQNPYPYFKISDCLILTSDYEGYPVVFTESKLFNLPIITTDVSDSKVDIDGQYGIVVKHNEENIAKAMTYFIKNGYKIKNKFNPKIFNKENLIKIKNLINEI